MQRLAAILPPQWSGIRLKTATMSSLALTRLTPYTGPWGRTKLDPELQGTGEG